MTTSKYQPSSKSAPAWVLVLASVASLMVALDTLLVGGANSMLRELGGVIGIAIRAAVFAATGSHASAEAFSDGFAPAIGFSAALSLLGTIAGIGLPARHQRTRAAIGRPHPLPALEAAG